MHILLSITFSLVMFSACAQSGEVFSTSDGAIRGYDPVAFFNEQKPVMGKPDISLEWNNATWHFVSVKNRQAFEADPTRYAPQYGGYCAYGTADGDGHKAPTQAETWTIVDGKLYFNYNKDVQNTWMKERAQYIIKADKNWPTVKKQE